MSFNEFLKRLYTWLTHKHVWVVRDKIVARSREGIQLKNAHADTVQRLVLGMTTIVYECKTCGALHTVSSLGN